MRGTADQYALAVLTIECLSGADAESVIDPLALLGPDVPPRIRRAIERAADATVEAVQTMHVQARENASAHVHLLGRVEALEREPLTSPPTTPPTGDPTMNEEEKQALALEAAQLAKSCGLGVVVTTALEGAVGRGLATHYAAALGITDDAAQKRVSRALDQLRTLLAKRGVALTAAGLATDLSALAANPDDLGHGFDLLTRSYATPGADAARAALRGDPALARARMALLAVLSGVAPRICRNPTIAEL